LGLPQGLITQGGGFGKGRFLWARGDGLWWGNPPLDSALYLFVFKTGSKQFDLSAICPSLK